MYRLPLPVRPGRAVSPDCLLRGVSRAHPAACPGVGNWEGSVPSSANDGPAVDGADPGDLVQPVSEPEQEDAQVVAVGGVAAAGQPAGRAGRGGARDGRELLSDLLVQGGDLGVDRVDQPQVQRDLGGVDVAEPAGQRLLQLRPAGLKPVVAERGQRRRGPFPRDQGVEEPAAADTEQVRDHHRDLQQRVLQDLLHPGLVPRLVLSQPGPGPGQHPQVPDRLRGHE